MRPANAMGPCFGCGEMGHVKQACPKSAAVLARWCPGNIDVKCSSECSINECVEYGSKSIVQEFVECVTKSTIKKGAKVSRGENVAECVSRDAIRESAKCQDGSSVCELVSTVVWETFMLKKLHDKNVDVKLIS